LRRIRFNQQLIVFIFFALLFVGFSAFLPGFFTSENILNLLRGVAVLGILGLGMAIVVIGRGIDLSMIAIMAIPSALVLQMLQVGHSLPYALLIGFGLAILTAVITGVLIAYAEVPALFTTLAMGLVLYGVGQCGMFEYEVIEIPQKFTGFDILGQSEFLGIPSMVLTFAVSAVLVELFMRKTRLGTFIYAIGDNPQAARTSGVSIRPMIVFQYVLAAVIATFAGLVIASSVGTMNTRIFNSNLIYDVILVVVLGGIGLSGGRGGVLNVVVGTLLIGTLINGMTIYNVSTLMQDLIKSLILLLAILIDSFVNPRNEETAQQGDI
jgi:ribose transport system permease protein